MWKSSKLAFSNVEPDTLLSQPKEPLCGDVVCGVATTNCHRVETRRATLRAALPHVRLAESGNRHPRSEPELVVQVSLGLEEMPDEVGILRRPAELMTSIRVALMGELSSGLRACLGPFCGQNFLTKAAKKDS